MSERPTAGQSTEEGCCGDGECKPADLFVVESFADEHDRQEHGRGRKEAHEYTDDGQVAAEG
jgi:hypothetical protein